MTVLLDGIDHHNAENIKDAVQLLNTIAYSAQAIQVAHLNMQDQIKAFENEMNLEESFKNKNDEIIRNIKKYYEQS